MEAELRTSFPDSNIRLIEGGGGVFDVTCNGRLIFSKKKKTTGKRLPDKGEITRLIKQESL